MTLDPIGLLDGIKHCFASVFGELNIAGEAWANKTLLVTSGRERYAEYMARRVGMFALFGTSRTTSVDDAYVAVRVCDQIARDIYKAREAIETTIRYEKVGQPVIASSACDPADALDSGHGGFALIGAPGSGKTTIFRHIAIAVARGRAVRGRRRLPIYIAARDLNTAEGARDAAEGLLTDLRIPDAARVMDALLADGSLLMLLDGIDECDRSHQQQLVSEMLELQARHHRNVFCMSARPLSLAVGLSNFEKWETTPLEFEQRLAFTRKWFSTVDNEKGARLLRRCASEPSLLDLGSNPLLLSILCALFHNELDIPSESDEMYDRAVIGLLGGWDAFRNIARHSALGTLSLRKRFLLSSHLAWSLLDRRAIAFSAGDVEKSGCLESAAASLQTTNFEAGEVLHALYNDFGLLVERSPGIYSFSHLTLQEYLAARHVVDHRLELSLLDRYRNDARWAEVIRLTGKLLASADQFLQDLHRGTRLDDAEHVQLLAIVWDSRPVCGNDVRLRLMREIATKVAGASRNVAVDLEARGDTLVVYTQGNPQEMLRIKGAGRRVADKNDERAQRRDHKSRKEAGPRATYYEAGVLACAPALLRILKSSGYSADDLRVADNRLFRIVGERDAPLHMKFVRADERRSR